MSPETEQSDNHQSGECLVLVSDTSTEAERLIASLRVRGFKVRDVPLTLLPGRVEAQRPRLVICDGQVARVADSVTRMRQGAWGKTVELLLLGIDLQAIESLRPVISDIDTRAFARPIDVYSVLQRVEEVLGQADPSARPGMRSMASLPRVGASEVPVVGRISSPLPRRARASSPNSLLSQRSDAMVMTHGEPAEPSAPKQPSIAPPSEISVSDSASNGVPVSRMSEELEQLLHDADRRLATGPMSLQPLAHAVARLSPEQELDAILPPDVLAALDDPVDLDDEDETSHPAARPRDRTSARAPDHSTALASNPVFSHPSVGTSALDEETPPGRPLGRARAATGTGSSEGSVEHASASVVMTPVPPSVKTHHTHHTQANASPLGSPALQATPTGEPLDAVSDRELPSSHQDNGWRRRHDADSVVPGTSPEIEHSSLQGSTGDQSRHENDTPDREASSTAPPHPRRPGGPSGFPIWESADESPATVMRREFARSEEPPPTIATRSGHEHHSTSNREFTQGRERAVPPLQGLSSSKSATRSVEVPGPPTGGGATQAAPNERDTSPPRAAGDFADDQRPNVELPPALGPGDVVRALSRCVRSRYSGALALEDESGIRRVVMREGDFVMVASGIEGESLIAFLIQRGDLNADAGRLARKLPQFGRHAGAALIAHGYLRQDELWPVLRAHAEWLLGRALLVGQGSAGLETDLPPRLSAEPAVFGGATGAEILIEVVRRVIAPEAAIATMGGLRVRITRGASSRLLSECALLSLEAQIVERAAGLTLEELLNQAKSPDFASALYAMIELGVLETMVPTPESELGERRAPPRDGLDDAAVRSRVGIRRGLVDEGDYFALLGVRREATGYEVRHAYLDLRREFEPSRLLTATTADLREDVDLVLEVLDEAYEILRDAARRERYRRALEAAPSVG